MTILLVTNAEDSWTAGVVHDRLVADGAQVCRFEIDRYPSTSRVVAYSGSGTGRSRIVSPDCTVDLASVTAVWHRRRRTAQAVHLHPLPDDVRNGIERESDASFAGVIEALPCFHLDDPRATQRARNRPLQLELARCLGLEVPRTLTTNDPDEALRFYDECGGRVVAKMLSSFSIKDADDHESVVMTSEVTADHLKHIGSLSLCPMTFQERIEKTLEFRITVVGYDVFAAAVESGLAPEAAIDWRRAYGALRPYWRAYDLPTDIRDKLLGLLDRLDMNYGAIDMILTPEGRFVFLETNPVGQFGWIEVATGLPISGSIAGLLTGRLPRRRSNEDVVRTA